LNHSDGEIPIKLNQNQHLHLIKSNTSGMQKGKFRLYKITLALDKTIGLNNSAKLEKQTITVIIVIRQYIIVFDILA